MQLCCCLTQWDEKIKMQKYKKYLTPKRNKIINNKNNRKLLKKRKNKIE